MAEECHTVLLVEDDRIDQLAFRRFIKEHSHRFDFEIVDSVSQAGELLKKRFFDVIITDFNLGDGTAFDIMAMNHGAPVIIATGAGDEEIAVKAMRKGAHDYIIKDPERNYLKILPITVEQAIQTKRSQREIKLLSDAIMSINDSVYITDSEDKIIFVNRAFHNCYGYGDSDIMGQPSVLLWKNADKSDRLKQFALKSGTTERSLEFKHVRKNRQEFPVSISASIVGYPSQSQCFWVYVVRDITERKRSESILRESKKRIKTILDSVQTGIILIDPITFTVVDANPIALNIIKAKPEEVIGKKSCEIICVDDHEHCLNTRRNHYSQNIESEIKDINGEKVPVMRTTIPIVLDNQHYLLENFVDISDVKKAEAQIKASLKEKEILLKEIHHRVKNNMQIISSLLNLQSSFIRDEHVLNIFKASQHRVKTMALVHEKLYQTKNFTQIDFKDYLESLSNYLMSSYSTVAEKVQLQMDIQNISLDINTAIPCGMIVNELISNALEHAFHNGSCGQIKVSFSRSNDPDGTKQEQARCVLTIEDDGCGLSQDFDINKISSLGLQLVTTLTEQLSGKMEIVSEKGTQFKITFPL
ncbi:hypothetical protein A2V82_09105 [candidate division KSB1 bacterium RBG_16_48_16]|nr:MAG: hypothetical protein A2V82_09105 [candidate division KSB1 bacterium RBG_16_48_16]